MSKSKTRLKFTADFETTTQRDDCRVWAFGVRQIGNRENRRFGNNIDDFMSIMAESSKDVLFHNLKFDGTFILNWLFRNGFKHTTEKRMYSKEFKTVISKMGQWYNVEVCFERKGKKNITVKFIDSFKLIPLSLAVMAGSYGLEIAKGNLDYNTPRAVGHMMTDEEFEYMENDVDIPAQVLELFYEEGLDKNTIGSNALSVFKDMHEQEFGKSAYSNNFPTLPIEIDTDIRKSYRGGFTWVNPLVQGKEQGIGMVFDVNSLYPYEMYDNNLPYGIPLKFDGEYKDLPEEKRKQYPLYTTTFLANFDLKPDKIPTVQIKGHRFFKGNEYLITSGEDPVEITMTNIDFDLFMEHYDVEILSFYHGYAFKQRKDLFKNYIDKFMEQKANSEGGKRQIAKLLLNNLYGKFASNPDVTCKIPFLKEDGSIGFKEGEEDITDASYTAMASFITSYARRTTISTAQQVYPRICYCDTDSIHITGTEIPNINIHDSALGAWQHEATFERAKFVRQKTYIENLYVEKKDENGKKYVDYTETEMQVKCAGMPESVKKNVKWEDFKIGLTLGGKLMPKQVAGGTVLLETNFTMH